MTDKEFTVAMERIIAAMKEKGYNPYEQLTGYVEMKEPLYITSHNGARSLIQTLDFDKVRKYLKEMKR